MIDNYDSFTYNLVQEMGKLGAEIKIFRNDVIDVSGLRRLNPSALIISPGPCTPDKAGISMDAISYFSGIIPIWGVCLGHQAIVKAFGGGIVHAGKVMHGKTSKIVHFGDPFFQNVETPFEAGRYHSLVSDRGQFPDELQVIAESDDGEVMAVRHRFHPTIGVQFHPESILTSVGSLIMKNFLDMM